MLLCCVCGCVLRSDFGLVLVSFVVLVFVRFVG